MSSIPSRAAIMAALLLATCFCACASGDSVADTGGDAGEIAEDAPLPDADVSTEPTVVDENVRLIYGYSGSTVDRAGEMAVGNPAEPGESGIPFWKDDFRFIGNVLPDGLNCTMGCRTDRDLKWIAVITGPSSDLPGNDMALLRTDDALKAVEVLPSRIAGVAEVKIAGSRLVLSKVKIGCEPATGPARNCYQFVEIDLSGNEATPEPRDLFTFPTSEYLADSSYSGRFTLTGDGNALVLQNPGKASATFWIWKDQQLRRVSKPICQTVGLEGECVYDSGAQDITDDRPVAITSDGGTLYVAYIENDSEFRLAAIDTATMETRHSRLVKAPGEYMANACYNTVPEWPYTTVLPPMLLSPDEHELVFTAASDCDRNTGKTWTNVVAVPVSAIGTLNSSDKGFFRNITNFPNRPTAGCVSIAAETIDISDSGRFLAFVGTPELDSSGMPIRAESPQHYSDREAFVTAMDGKFDPIQVSGDLFFRASSVLWSGTDPWFATITDPVQPE